MWLLGRATKSGRLHNWWQVQWFGCGSESSFVNQTIAQRPYQQSEFSALFRRFEVSPFSSNQIYLNFLTYFSTNRHCVSGSLDGKLIIWDTWTGNKVQVFFKWFSFLKTISFEKLKLKKKTNYISGNSITFGMGHECRICSIRQLCR